MKKILSFFFICFLFSSSSYESENKFIIKAFYIYSSNEYMGVCVIANERVEILALGKNCKRIKGSLNLISNFNRCCDFSEKYALNISRKAFLANQFNNIDLKYYRKCKLKIGDAICFIFPKEFILSDEIRISYFEVTSRGNELKEEIYQIQRTSLDTLNLGTNLDDIKIQVSHCN